MVEDIYVIDASSLIRIKPEDYPQDIFVSLWSNMENLVKEGRLKSSILVFDELKRKDDNIYKWAKKNKNMLFIDITPQQTKIVKEILKTDDFRALVDHRAQGGEADPFIIAIALEKDVQQTLTSFNKKKIVVTEEKLRGNKITIPYVCQHFGIECIKIFDMFRREGWWW